VGILLAGVAVSAQVGFFPLEEVRPGMQGVGRTVFSGERIEEFQAEILGVVENTGPGQSLILARLAGGPLATTGVLQGMSGSPVYIDGRLVGAVAMTFSYAKEPIAAIRPIAELLRAGEAASAPRAARRPSPFALDVMAGLEPPADIAAGGVRFVDIATPVSFAGFTQATLERFAPRLRGLGFQPCQGVSGGGRLKEALGDPAALQPGSMISVQLMTGDMSVGAEGTVTHIDGAKVYAFGHRLLGMGTIEMPFARAEVIALLPSLSTSSKVSTPKEWMGVIREDRSTGVAGEVGRRAAMAPLTISVTSQRAGARSQRLNYRMEIVDDPLLSPALTQMALYSAVDASERSVGQATVTIRGEIQFEGSPAPVRLDSVFAGDYGLPQEVSQVPAARMAFAMQGGFKQLRLKSVRIDVESVGELRQMQIDDVWPSRWRVRPGEDVELTVVLSGPDRSESYRKLTYHVPVGAASGPLYFTVADGGTTNLEAYRRFMAASPRSASQVVSFLNSLRDNSKAYVRVWKPAPTYDAQGHALPAPPASVDQILARAQPGQAAAAPSSGAQAAELELEAGGWVVSGSKTIQVEIRP